MATNVCNYFLQGKCRFGQKCRNFHPGAQANAFNSLTARPGTLGPSLNNPYNQSRQQQQAKPGGQYNRYSFLKDDDGGNTWSSSNTTNSLFDRTNRSSTSVIGGLNPFLGQSQEVAMDDDDVIDVESVKATLRADVIDWNNSALWPLTSYSPITGISLFPEFTDVSTEEMRWEYCKACLSNSLQEYNSKLNQLVLSHKMLMSQLVTASTDNIVNRLSLVKEKLLTTTNPIVITSPPSSSLASSDKPSTTTTATLSSAKQPTTTTSTIPKSSPQVTSSSSLTTKGPSSSLQASLTSEDIAAFKAKNFTLYKIPTHAPPPELC
ncbi:nucleoporin NUP42-like isoform X2 [Dysidea avara]|uniref:nucleoporin NUP42-like isoform X2 n=1 Tax=Dysidea avara TaxID=196820 RepID=UPI003330EE38